MVMLDGEEIGDPDRYFPLGDEPLDQNGCLLPSIAQADVEAICATIWPDEETARYQARTVADGGWLVQQFAPPIGTEVAEIRFPATCAYVGAVRFAEVSTWL